MGCKTLHKNELLNALQKLREDTKDFYLGSEVPQLSTPPNPLEFYRSFVSYNRPVLIKNAISHWPAKSLWTHEYLRTKLGQERFSVAVTPNGLADAITDGYFVMPLEESMTMNDFLDIIERKSDDKENNWVYYIQKQNSNLSEEFSVLENDVSELDWAREAFGKAPDAVNFWMGDERAVTSTHKDPYENIYAVVKGYKDIILYPPTDLPLLNYKDFKAAKYVRSQDNQSLVIEEVKDMQEVPWITVDPLDESTHAKVKPLYVRVEAGDVLYLPSLWFHHLRQSHGCVAVNFWYDMEFDSKYCYFNFLQSVNKLRLNC